MKYPQLTIGLIVSGILLLIGLGVFLFGLSQGGSIPDLGGSAVPPSQTPSNFAQLQVTPPPSLDEIADDIREEYPELADLLENPELSSVYKDFYLAYQDGGSETALALARQRGILNDADQIVMTLILNSSDSEDLIAELEAEGIIIEANFRTKLNILIPVSTIEEQLETEAPDLILERISNLEQVIRLEFPKRANTKEGRILGQGVDVTFANHWHNENITGQGIKVGVLDLGFADYEDLEGTELPQISAVATFGDDSDFDYEVHGTACAEIVHEMAPDAELVFAYYDGSDAAMGEAVEWLLEQEVDIISNSTGSNGLTPMDGTGFVAELVNEAHDQGVFWVNAAGNEADAHYRGEYRDSDNNDLHEFASATETIPFVPFESDIEVQIILSWDDWVNVDQDYELILYDGEGNFLAKSEEVQDGGEGQYPIEGIFYIFDDTKFYYLSIENYDGLARGDATFDLFVHGGYIDSDFVVPEYSLSSPSDAQGAFAVGAVHWADDILEFYSSNGPTSDGRIKPDLAAPSVVDNASYEDEAFNGTSAAAPHVAGAAALVMQQFPEFSPDDVATFLKDRSLDLGPTGPDNAFGAGRLNLGQSPDNPDSPDAILPVSNDVLPTSTPRPAVDAAPPQTIDIEGGTNNETTDDSSFGSAIVLAGLCLMCLAGMGIPIVLGFGFLFLRRKS